MVCIKTEAELDKMRQACRISALALKAAERFIRPGISTFEIDREIHREILALGAKPSFLGYGGFPASACISVNDVVIHGIPSKDIILKEGDVVSVDVGAYYNGFHGDNAFTYPCGEISEEARKLLNVTRECLVRGIEKVCPGNRIGDISAAVQTHAEANGFAVVEQFVGHGVGRALHEDPSVPNFVGRGGRGIRLVPGMTLAIEPMINGSGKGVRILSDKWTTVTQSGSLSAHFEHTVAVVPGGVEILTLTGEETK